MSCLVFEGFGEIDPCFVSETAPPLGDAFCAFEFGPHEILLEPPDLLPVLPLSLFPALLDLPNLPFQSLPLPPLPFQLKFEPLILLKCFPVLTFDIFFLFTDFPDPGPILFLLPDEFFDLEVFLGELLFEFGECYVFALAQLRKAGVYVLLFGEQGL